MYKLALFDLDGTLTDPKIGITKSVRYALSFFGIEVSDLDTLTKFIGPPLRDSFTALYGFTPKQAETAVAKYREYFAVTGIFENTLYSGITKLLSALRENDIKTAIATSKPTVYAKRIITHFGLAGYFDLIQGSELDGTRSRKSEVIACVLKSFHINYVGKTVMIGDREHDVIGAKEIGIDSIGVLWGYGTHEELRTAGATNIAKTTEELLDLIMRR